MALPSVLPNNEQTVEVTYVRDDYARGIRIPWFFKMALKILLSKVPLPYALWTSLGIFRHGDTNRNLDNLHKGFDRYLAVFKSRFERDPVSFLELGPGDSAGHALSAYVSGINKSWLIDVGDFATQDLQHYKAYYNYLKNKGLWPEGLQKPSHFSRKGILEHTNAEYMTGGLSDLQNIPENILDLSFSTAVLEHVRRSEFQDLMHALFRAHAPQSLSVHCVDLHDHLGGALNSMRFSSQFWESPHVQNAGFYTNRLTMQEMAKCAENAGFGIEVIKITRWTVLPTSRAVLHRDFRLKTDDELNICTFLFCLHKPA